MKIRCYCTHTDPVGFGALGGVQKTITRLDSHIKYMGTPPGPSREVRLRRAPPAAQTPAGGARGGMLSMEAGRARCRPRGPRTQPAPAMWRSTCISYGVRISADELILERFGLRHTNTWGTHHVIWLTNICTFLKIARGGKSTLISVRVNPW